MDAVEFPSHRHPLKLVELLRGEENQEEKNEDDSDEEVEKDDDEKNWRVCGLCGKKVKGSRYECSECNFTAHLDCASNPPSLVIEESKIHEHTLTLLPRYVTFTCNACGHPGKKSPYLCLKCSFMVHGDCINLPHVIKISRHQHRISHTFCLGAGKWTCGVCRKSIDGKYGGYRCRSCEGYAVHLRCAWRKDVWDGMGLEGVPEEDDFEIEPFEHIAGGVILHDSHEHHIRLANEYGNFVCSGCAHPIYDGTFYRCCLECDFFLHEYCANLPRKKAMFLHVHPLTLCTDERSHPNNLSRCDACHLYFNGFRYRCLECKDVEFDVKCISVSNPFLYYFHKHPLFPFEKEEDATICNVCNHDATKYVLTCMECDFRMCFACATLPHKVNYKYDKHPLCQTSGQRDFNPFWCDICENKIEELSYPYKCSKCGPVLHIECALGSFRNMRQGLSFITHGHKYEVVLNDRTLQIRCSHCHKDCHEPLLLMSTTTTDVSIFLCSSRCFTAYVSV